MCPFSFQHMIPHYPGLGIFFTASLSFLYALIATLVLIRMGWAKDVPNNRSSHTMATPTLGGLSFALPMLVMLHATQPLTVIVALIAMLVLGGMDDMYGLSYRTRLTIQCLAGILVLTCSSLWITSFNTYPVVMWGVSLFLLVGLINGTNFIDGLNGLLTGCVMMAIFIWAIATPALMPLWLVSLASLCAFWLFNRHGQIFMGDLGSTFLGLWMGIVALTMQQHHLESAIGGLCTQGLLVTLAPLMFVWGDVTITLCHRWWRGEVLSQAHREHIIHRLADAGYGHTRVTSLYMLSVLYMGSLTLLYCSNIMPITAYIPSYLIPQALLVYGAFKASRRRL